MSRTRGDGVFTSTEFGEETLSTETHQASLYAYSILAPSNNVELTLGISYDLADDKGTRHMNDTKTPEFDRKPSQLSPKLGVRAEVMDGLVLRGAVFRTSKREFVSDQTLEPTTVSGFAQFFDDFNRADAWTAAAGVDFRAADNVWTGGSISIVRLKYRYRLENSSFDGEEHGVIGYATPRWETIWL